MRSLPEREMSNPTERALSIDQLVAEGRRFGTVYADPPWPYRNQSTRASTDNHYQTMTLDDLAAMPVRELADATAHLHLWTTNGFLREAFDIIDAWGFTYKSCFVWCKPQMGIGNYWRVSHEFLLLGVRGNLTFPESFQSYMLAPRSRHSAKPDRIRQLIESVSPSPRLELFTREQPVGWTCWGMEVEPTLFTAAQGRSLPELSKENDHENEGNHTDSRFGAEAH